MRLAEIAGSTCGARYRSTSGTYSCPNGTIPLGFEVLEPPMLRGADRQVNHFPPQRKAALGPPHDVSWAIAAQRCVDVSAA
jgi:hypothetical protein